MSEMYDSAIEHATLIHASPDVVYDAIASAEGLDSWFTVGSSVDARPNGHIHFKWVNWGVDKVTTEAKGPILEAERPKRFVFQWHGDDASYFTTIEIVFEPTEEGTVVRLHEDGYKNTPQGRHSILDCATGWGEALTLLKFYVEHGISTNKIEQ